MVAFSLEAHDSTWTGFLTGTSTAPRQRGSRRANLPLQGARACTSQVCRRSLTGLPAYARGYGSGYPFRSRGLLGMGARGF